VLDHNTHKELRKHIDNARAAHKQVGDSMDKIEQIVGALRGAPDGAQPPTQHTMPGLTAQGVSPLGGLAQWKG
jgi:hypothetical protein